MAGVADNGDEPVKTGGVYNATLPTLTAGFRGASQVSSHGALLVAQVIPDSSWAVNNNPAVNTQAVVTQAAGAAGVRHVCTSITASLTSGTTGVTVPATPVNVRLRDGVSGAGTVLFLCGLSVPTTAGAADHITLTGLQIVGSAATAMTLEFGTAGGANSFEIVSMTGYDITF